MDIIAPIFLNVIFTVGFYLLERYTDFKKLNKHLKHVIVGIAFGGTAIAGSELGLAMSNAVMNIRDAGPLLAGLVFGWQAGLIAGVIGGAYRALSILWGAGTYTVVACSLATVVAGIIGAVLRKVMFDDKKPTWAYATGIAVVCEVVHMLLIFLTNMDDATQAFHFVRICSIPMISLNALTVGFSVFLVTLISKGKEMFKRPKYRNISQTFQSSLLVCILVAFVITSFFTYQFQSGMSEVQVQDMFATTISDIKKDVRGKSDANMLAKLREVKADYLLDPTQSLFDLADKHDVAEINVVNKEGKIIATTIPNLDADFNMYESEQSKQFMCLAGDRTQDYLVQDYMENGIGVMRKYAGIYLSDGMFIQVGYDAKQFHETLNPYVIDYTKNRHVGVSGFVAVCDESLKLLTEDIYNGKSVTVIGIQPDENMLAGRQSTEIMETEIVNASTGYTEEYIYVYTFAEGYCIIAAMLKDEAMIIRDGSVYVNVFMQIIVFAALFLLLYFLIKRVIINNIHKINTTLSKISSGNLNETVDVHTNVEFSSLSDDINATVDTLKKYIKDAEARIDVELEYAKTIQLSALPSVFPPYPGQDDFDIYASMIAAKEVGGDFYDFYRINGHTVAFLVADVSGKGIPAAMFMMTAKTIIKDLAESKLPVNEILTRANEKLCENNESNMFVTAWMGIVDLDNGMLTYANAGHNPPIIVRDGKAEYLKSRPGFVLAGMEGVKYRLNELQLKPTDRIYLYTDGVTEATDLNNELYGEDRLIDFINANSDVEANTLLPAIKSDIDNFIGEAPQFDDITMLMFDFKSFKTRGLKMTEKTVVAKDENLDEVIAFFEEELEKAECPMKTTVAVTVALEEIFVNVAHYAYEGNEGDVKVGFHFDDKTRVATFEFTDTGVPFNPLNKKDPDVTLSAEDRNIGGLGIYITKKTMDKISYRYENEENILTMVKKI